MEIINKKSNINVNVLLLFTSLYCINKTYDNSNTIPVFDSVFYKSTIFITTCIYNCQRILENKIINRKLYESVSSFLFYIINTILLHICLNDKEWFHKLVFFDNVDNHIFSSFELLIYKIQISHYLLELYHVSNKKIKRKDDTEMFIHHIVTLTLIIGSYYRNIIRGGLYVMYLHDINDVFLQLSKTLVYLGYKENITNCTFGIFICSWVYTRLYLFGRLTYDMGVTYYNMNLLLNILFYSLCSLYILNLIWFKMIFQILLKTIFENKLEDIREN